jgi:hypothetical protein
MRGNAFRRFAATAALTLAVSATAAAAAFANEGPQIRVAAPRTSERARTITFSGETTAHFSNLRAYWEPVLHTGTACAHSFAHRPGRAQTFGWDHIVPQHAAGLVSFHYQETVTSGDRGEIHVLCAYLENGAGDVGARARGAYRDPAQR